MKSHHILILIGIFILLSCGNTSTMEDIDTVIKNYDNVDFNVFEGKTIYCRGAGKPINSSAYLLYNMNCFPYVVVSGNRTNDIIYVKKHLISPHCKDTLSDAKIHKIMNEYFKYNLYTIRADTNGNIYINPYEHTIPFILKKASHLISPDLHEYRLYRGDWYIKKEY